MQLVSESLYLSESIILLLRDLIQQQTGVYYTLENCSLLADKLADRVMEHDFNSFLDYYYLLKYDTAAQTEWQHVMDAISVQETFFYREFDQIAALVDVIVPTYFDQNPSKPLRIWSAACATGEEPLSIAIALQEAGWFNKMPIEIYATDASPAAIANAQLGLYRERSFRSFPQALRDRYFEPKSDPKGDRWRIRSDIHHHITWKRINLARAADIQTMPPVQVVFCRNVFIYFSDDAIAQTTHQLFNAMTDHSYLFIGASESLLRLGTNFELQQLNGAFVYVKRSCEIPGNEATNDTCNPCFNR
ncbi:MAG: protein-glutamate O-methyltransferase CheR [Lyngbya sp. HA4199-MV5]|jgi:chemotaxis protein methyltransferase CheR|nr:protein-glutamate O-methyltransferase CheR [Lyngbya sp. HA4199-MV5]